MSADAPTPDAAPSLPSLDPGVTLLDVDDGAAGALQSLVVDRLVCAEGGTPPGRGPEAAEARDGPASDGRDVGGSDGRPGAVWLDSRGRASTRRMHDVAPSPRLLERIRVARAFTPFQHHRAVEHLPDALRPDDALLVLPAVDHFYRGEDLVDGEGRAMLADALDRVEALADERGVPVLATRAAADPLGRLVRERADRRIACRATAMGPRFDAPDFETLVYPAGAGTVQTTLAFWRRTLAHRWSLATDVAGAEDPTEQGGRAGGATGADGRGPSAVGSVTDSAGR